MQDRIQGELFNGYREQLFLASPQGQLLLSLVSRESLSIEEPSVLQLVEHILTKPMSQRTNLEIQFLHAPLTTVAFFKELDATFDSRFKTKLFRHLKYEFIPAQTEIFRAGEPGLDVYVILKGEVRLLVYNENLIGEGIEISSPEEKEFLKLNYPLQTVLETKKAGDLFGELSLRQRSTREYTAVTSQDTSFAKISRFHFKVCLGQYFAVKRDGYIEILKNSSEFVNWKKNEIELALLSSTSFKLVRGETFLAVKGEQQEDNSKYVFIVCEGEIEIFRQSIDSNIINDQHISTGNNQIKEEISRSSPQSQDNYQYDQQGESQSNENTQEEEEKQQVQSNNIKQKGDCFGWIGGMKQMKELAQAVSDEVTLLAMPISALQKKQEIKKEYKVEILDQTEIIKLKQVIQQKEESVEEQVALIGNNTNITLERGQPGSQQFMTNSQNEASQKQLNQQQGLENTSQRSGESGEQQQDIPSNLSSNIQILNSQGHSSQQLINIQKCPSDKNKMENLLANTNTKAQQDIPSKINSQDGRISPNLVQIKPPSRLNRLSPKSTVYPNSPTKLKHMQQPSPVLTTTTATLTTAGTFDQSQNLEDTSQIIDENFSKISQNSQQIFGTSEIFQAENNQPSNNQEMSPLKRRHLIHTEITNRSDVHVQEVNQMQMDKMRISQFSHSTSPYQMIKTEQGKPLERFSEQFKYPIKTLSDETQKQQQLDSSKIINKNNNNNQSKLANISDYYDGNIYLAAKVTSNHSKNLNTKPVLNTRIVRAPRQKLTENTPSSNNSNNNSLSNDKNISINGIITTNKRRSYTDFQGYSDRSPDNNNNSNNLSFLQRIESRSQRRQGSGSHGESQLNNKDLNNLQIQNDSRQMRKRGESQGQSSNRQQQNQLQQTVMKDNFFTNRLMLDGIDKNGKYDPLLDIKNNDIPGDSVKTPTLRQYSGQQKGLSQIQQPQHQQTKQNGIGLLPTLDQSFSNDKQRILSSQLRQQQVRNPRRTFTKPQELMPQLISNSASPTISNYNTKYLNNSQFINIQTTNNNSNIYSNKSFLY